MKTIATMALMLGMIAVGTAPAAEAHDVRGDRHVRGERHDHGNRWDAPRQWRRANHHDREIARHQVREIRNLAHRLERATDDLKRDSRRAAGRVNRHEARALRAIHRLEEASDRLVRQAKRHDRRSQRALGRGLHDLETAFVDARRRAFTVGLVRSGEVRADLRRVNYLIGELDAAVDGRRGRFARHGRWGYRLAQR